jgi:hypothetical protein
MGRTWIHQHLRAWTTSPNARIVMAAVIHSRLGLRAQKLVPDRSLMVQKHRKWYRHAIETLKIKPTTSLEDCNKANMTRTKMDQEVQIWTWIWSLENRIIKDGGLYTIVIPSTSPHPTPLKRRYEGMMNSSWIHILFQQYFSYGKEIRV